MSETASRTAQEPIADLKVTAEVGLERPTSRARIDVDALVAAVEPMILEYTDRIEEEGSVPDDLAGALYESGALRTLLPREYGGLECHPLDYFEVVYRLSQLNGSVGWLAAIQPGASVLLPPDVMGKVVPPTRWITAGSAGRIGKAYLADGGLRVNGRWPFASGSPHATYVHVLAMVVDENDQPIISEQTQQPQVVNAVLRRDQITCHDTWNGLGLRGTSSGDISVDNAFVPDDHVQRGPWIDHAYSDRPLYRVPFGMHGHAAHALGVARSAIDAFIDLAHRPPKPGSKRQSALGRQQIHQVGVAKADAMVRAARLFVKDTFERALDSVQTQEEADFELRVQLFQAGLHGVRTAREAMQIVFELSGTDGVMRGRKMEACFRDLSTAAQHAIYAESAFTPVGQFYLTKDGPDGVQIDDPPPHFGTLPMPQGRR